jgi:hypothetical protein
MRELARYVVDNYSKGTTEEFADLFITVESFLDNPDPELENLIAVGLFEDIQNIASHRKRSGRPRGQRSKNPDGGSFGDAEAPLIPRRRYRRLKIRSFGR